MYKPRPFFLLLPLLLLLFVSTSWASAQGAPNSHYLGFVQLTNLTLQPASTLSSQRHPQAHQRHQTAFLATASTPEPLPLRKLLLVRRRRASSFLHRLRLRPRPRVPQASAATASPSPLPTADLAAPAEPVPRGSSTPPTSPTPRPHLRRRVRHRPGLRVLRHQTTTTSHRHQQPSPPTNPPPPYFDDARSKVDLNLKSGDKIQVGSTTTRRQAPQRHPLPLLRQAQDPLISSPST
ncbi:uncharacterized protein A4U43_C05F3100 [Asparagus officinalis]|uniref:Uncharacterized protein n=1 Tax=Asparagus officinalis TaxID=4686 RepID=A0A5P1ENY3_ASPOF|nr:uncharacterized protein A4U43_C05F3100 [Asparagus officinalis]